MVSTCPVIFKSSSPCTNSLATVPRALTTIGIIVSFNSLAKVEVLISLFTFFNFTLRSAETAKSTILQVHFFLFFFFFCIIKSGLLAEIRWPVCISKSQRYLFIWFSMMYAGLYIYHWFVWKNFKFLRISQWITLPTHSCLILYSFFANLQHSLIIWLIVSFLSPHNLHLLFCCILSNVALIWLVLMALFCAAIRRYSVSLLKFPFFSHVQVFSSEMLLVSRLTSLELFFFPRLFSGYCRSTCPRVISIVSSDCNQSSSVLLYVVFESLYRCVHAVFNAGQVLFLPLFLTHIVCQRHLFGAMSYGWSLVFLFPGRFV